MPHCLPIIKDGVYVINLDKYKSVRTHLINVFVKGSNFVYLDSFGVEQIHNQIPIHNLIPNIATNIFRTQVDDSIMCEYFCIKFTDFCIRFVSYLRVKA